MRTFDATIEPTIGPYEVYEDEWFNYKAGFESYITVRDQAETDKLARFSRQQGVVFAPRLDVKGERDTARIVV